MSFDFPLGQFTEIDQRNMANLKTRSSEDKVGVVTRKRNHIVDFILLEFEGFNDVLDFKFEQIY